MNKVIKKLLGLIILVSIASCGHDEPTRPNFNIDFNFTSPTEDFMYPLGDTVRITGTISSDSEMHGYNIELINASNYKDILLHRHVHEDGAIFNVSDYWVNTVSHHTNLILKITVDINHEGDVAEKTYYFMAHHM